MVCLSSSGNDFNDIKSSRWIVCKEYNINPSGIKYYFGLTQIAYSSSAGRGTFAYSSDTCTAAANGEGAYNNMCNTCKSNGNVAIVGCVCLVPI